MRDVISDEEFLEYVSVASAEGFARRNGWVRIGTLAELIRQRHRFYNTELAEAQIVRLETRGLVKVRRFDGMVLGVYI